MTKIKITDLDKFVIQHIKNPFLSLLPDDVGEKITLKNVVSYLQDFPEWAAIVMSRIKRIDFYFPKYVIHPLVFIIRDWVILEGERA